MIAKCAALQRRLIARSDEVNVLETELARRNNEIEEMNGKIERLRVEGKGVGEGRRDNGKTKVGSRERKGEDEAQGSHFSPS